MEKGFQSCLGNLKSRLLLCLTKLSIEFGGKGILKYSKIIIFPLTHLSLKSYLRWISAESNLRKRKMGDTGSREIKSQDGCWAAAHGEQPTLEREDWGLRQENEYRKTSGWIGLAHRGLRNTEAIVKVQSACVL